MMTTYDFDKQVDRRDTDSGQHLFQILLGMGEVLEHEKN